MNIKDKSVLIKTLASESFLEKIILLFITVFISGLLVPYISNEIQRGRSKNEIILQAQSKLIDDVSKTLLTYETLLADISWFKTPEAYDSIAHQRAFEKYTDRSVDLLVEWRQASVKAHTLASPQISAALDSLQMKMFELQDTPMNVLHKKGGTKLEWKDLHSVNIKMLLETKDLIVRLSKEMNISKTDIK